MAQQIFVAGDAPANRTVFLTGVRVNGVDTVIFPLFLDNANPNLLSDISDALNSLGFGFLFIPSYVNSGEEIRITTTCTNEVVNLFSTALGEEVVNYSFTGEDCELADNCDDVTATITGDLTIDCDDLNCLTFTDTTGGYSASNEGGYGEPNFPAIADILSTTFNLWNEAGDELLGSFTSEYIPSEGGNVGVCITPAQLGFTFVKGTNYKLQYQLNLSDATVKSCLTAEFKFPCCGDPVSSNLLTKFTILQKLGCGSIDFTDTTGTYNASTNTGGYGTPNPGYADIVSTEIEITKPSGEVITITDFIPTADNPTINITAADINESEKFPDDVYTFVYKVFVIGDCRVGYKSSQVLFSCQTLNCLQSQINKLLKEDCTGCNTDKDTERIWKMVEQYEFILLASKQDISCVVGDMAALLKKCGLDCPVCG